MKHLGDITKLKGSEVPLTEIVVGGSPCQDLSVAGKRAGLAGERSGLFMEQIRLIKEMRENDRKNGRTDEHIRPRFMVWENVPGAFSSNKGEDFRAVLEETAKVAEGDACIPGPPNGKWPYAGCIMGDGWSIAWRLHDAQFWGVPQRRKRIALVADFGGESAPEILFERKGVSRDTEESGKEGEGAATDVERGVGETSYYEWHSQDLRVNEIKDNVSPTLSSAMGMGGASMTTPMLIKQESDIGETSKCLNGWDVQSKHIQPEEGIAEALYSGECRGGGGESYVMQSRVYGIGSYDSNAMKSDNPHSGIYQADTSRTLDLNGTEHHAVAYRKTSHAKSAEDGQGWAETEVNDTLNAFDSGETRTPTVVLENHPADSRVKISEDGVVQTLSSRMGTGGGNVPMVMEQGFAMQAIGEYKDCDCASSLKQRDYKDSTDLVVAYGLDRSSYNQGQNAKFNFAVDKEKVGTCVAKGPNAVFQSVVRRLTPLECERLQGFPDGWTDIGEWYDSKGKKHKDADSPRYKALGNSIALPFWQYLADKMCAYLNKPTMASLFDGIGGFPLVFSRAGAKPIWASEIEEFPIAVTKIRFPEENK